MICKIITGALVFAVLTTAACARECDLNYTPGVISMDTIAVHAPQLRTVVLSNTGTTDQYCDRIDVSDNTLYQAVSVQCTPAAPFALQSGQSLTLTFTITARHNVDWSGVISLSIRCLCSSGTITIPFAGRGTSALYPTTNQREYGELLDTLRMLVANHNSLGYKQAREVMFGKADNVDDSVECIYSGKKLKTAGIPPNGEFNTEHCWIQSRGSSAEPMKSDIYHLYPTNPNANTIRANYPFGTVQRQWRDAGGGSRLGFTAAGDTVFEPRDVSKGNIARSMFYYLIRYGNLTSFYTSPYTMDADLRRWNSIDPPDARERQRADTIAAYQGRRNPFVDYAELVERIDFVPNRHSDALRIVQRELLFNPSMLEQNWEATLVNRGPDTLQLQNISVSYPAWLELSFADSSRRIAPHGMTTMSLKFSPQLAAVPDKIVVRIEGSNSTVDSLILVQCVTMGLASHPPPASVEIIPHPLQSASTLVFRGMTTLPSWIRVYSLQGEEILDLSSEAQLSEAGLLLQIRSTDLPPGSRAVFVRCSYGGRLTGTMMVVDR